MLAVPTSSATLLPGSIPPPGTLSQPSPLLLPRGCLLPGTLLLLLLPGLLRSLPLLLLLAACLRLLRLSLIALLLCGWRRALLSPTLLPFILLAALRIRRGNRP
jgi:hypothetical protein